MHPRLLAIVVTSLLARCSAAESCPSVLHVWSPGYASINSSSDASNKYGLEDGIVVRRADGGFSMIAAAMYTDPVWVKMRLDIWRSDDALTWRKVRSVRTSSGREDGTDIHAAHWGPFLVHDAANDTWALSYVAYRAAPQNASGWLLNFDGRIYARYANASGDAGLGGDFYDADYAAADALLLAPDGFDAAGPWPHPCQGLQGTDSFYPYQLNATHWAAFVGSSHQETPDPWPQPRGGKWVVSLATAPALAGPWTRHNPSSGGAPADAPCVDLNGGFAENPIVSPRPDDARGLHVVHDWLDAEARGFGYGCSSSSAGGDEERGLRWPPTSLVPLPFGCRTPFGLVPLTVAEVARMAPAIERYGVINASQISARNSSLQWLFYTACPPPGGDYCIGDGSGFEAFYASIVWLSW